MKEQLDSNLPYHWRKIFYINHHVLRMVTIADAQNLKNYRAKINKKLEIPEGYLLPFKFKSGCATKNKIAGPIQKQIHMAEPTEDEIL
jgi:hypothetical protein